MANLSTRFFGLELKNPLVIASSGLTNSLENIKTFAESGAGAVVLKSIFEEEVYFEYEEMMRKQGGSHHFHEHLDYFDYQIKDENVKDYIRFISDVKDAVDIPIVASINCISSGDWVQFASKIEAAGADAIELNLFILPSDLNKSASEASDFYLSTVKAVLAKVNIPVSVKISSYFSNLGGMVKELADAGVAGVTMFNRFYSPDVDLDSLSLKAANVLSSPSDYVMPLRWIGLLSGRVDCQLAATTGIHDAATAIKMVLAGADAVQLASVFYHKGPNYARVLLDDMEKWMEENGFASVDEMKGKLSFTNAKNPGWYERVQFMNYFGEYNG